MKKKDKQLRTPQWFKGKKVTVFGIGSLGGGVSVIRYLVAQGAEVIATDIKSKEALKTSLISLKKLKGVTFVLGQHRQEDFTHVDMVIKTPSCPWTNKHIKLARAHNIPVETDASLFMQLCKNPIIGITGTKGKTTTSQMITHLLKKTGKRPLQVGVGITPVLDRLLVLKKDHIVVFELSSWRLSGLRFAKISPHIAVFTNFFPDHMNYYKTMQEYLADKKNIFLYQKTTDTIVYNRDDAEVYRAIKDAPSQRIPVSCTPQHLIDARYFVDGADAYVRNANTVKKLFALEEIPARGMHNKRNMLMACAALEALGVKQSKVISAVASFTSPKHRLEFVGKHNGVDYYNDTAATNPRAAIAALESFDRPIILLAGGADKNLSGEEFAHAITQKTKAVLFFKGSASEKIIKALQKISPIQDKTIVPLYDTMDDIVAHASDLAHKGDIVLLSPGAASFGLFANEFDRGKQFCASVQKLHK